MFKMSRMYFYFSCMNGLLGGVSALSACVSERVSECCVFALFVDFVSLKTYTLILFDPIRVEPCSVRK